MILFENNHHALYVSHINGFSFITHVHEELEMLICIQGELKASCGSETKILRPGDALTVFSHQVHAYQQSVGQGILIIVSPHVVPLFIPRLKNQKYENFRLKQDPELVRLACSIYKEWIGSRNSDILIGYLYIILGTILKDMPCSPIKDSMTAPDSFTQILEYLSAHFTEPISLKELASNFGVNHSHLSRTFHAKLSCGYLEYLHQLRIDQAKRMLLGSEEKISQIALDCGFSDLRSFNRVFRQITGTTPREFRHGARPPAADSLVADHPISP